MIFVNTFADSSSGIGALGVDGKDFIIQLITFLLAYWVLNRYAFGPILKVLRTRRQVIEDGVRLGEEMKRQQTEMEAKVEKAMHEARAKADEIIAGAQDTGRQLAQEAETKARDKAASIIAAAEDRIKQDTAQARRALEKELVGLVADATEAIIDEKVDTKKDSQLIERALKDRQAA
jgi:F-type H+-transporting ATPase subunit b